MIISKKHNFIFLHIPKCAGTSVKKLLQTFHDDVRLYGVENHLGRQFDMCHITLDEYENIFIRKLTHPKIMAVIRDPYERVYSSFKEYEQHINSYFRQSNHADILTLLRSLTHDDIENDAKYIHFRPQSSYTHSPNGEQIVTIITNIKDLDSSDLNGLFQPTNVFPSGILPRINKNFKLRSELSNDVIQEVNRLYNRDFELLPLNKKL
jgi:hypothetical protein